MAELGICSNLIYSPALQIKPKQKAHTSGKCENPVISTI